MKKSRRLWADQEDQRDHRRLFQVLSRPGPTLTVDLTQLWSQSVLLQKETEVLQLLLPEMFGWHSQSELNWKLTV